MPISEKRYVNITSGVGAAEVVPTRNLSGNFFTENALVPTSGRVSFTSANDVADYFGSSSVEYARAVVYFGWISKNITTPQEIVFTRWANVATAPQIFGAKGVQAIATWQAITAGSFTLQMGATTHTFTGLDFSGDANLAAVAATIQTAIRAITAGASLWTAATVTFDATRSSFDLTGGTAGAATITVTAGSGGSDIAAQLGWLSATAIFSQGSVAQSITDVLVATAENDNNFGSFAFVPTLTQDQIVEAGIWNNAQNVMFMYSVPVTSSNAAAISAATLAFAGTTLTLSPIGTEYPEQIPMMILAATDYTLPNSVQNYMFQSNFLVTPSVLTDADANTYDALRVNYYGQTQAAGKLIQFYQRALMMGGSNAPIDQNTYANEMWLKDNIAAAVLSLMLALPEIPANLAGRSMVLTTLQASINQALTNGVISVGKTLTNTQKLFITQVTADSVAWQQVQNQGYWVNAVVQSYTNDITELTEYKVVYTLVYSKSDAIRLVEGQDILI